MSKRGEFYLIVVFISIMVITVIHYATPPTLQPLHAICIDLFYIPVLIGSLVFGLRGAALTYGSVLIVCFPYILIVWHVKMLFPAEDLVRALLLGAFAFVAGSLSNLEARYRKKSEQDHYLSALARAVAVVAHDLRSPLTAIMVFAKRIHEGKENNKAATEFIMSAAQTMQMVVDSTLDFAKPLHLKIMKEDINVIANRASAACVTNAGHRGIDVLVRLSSKGLLVPVDGFLLERALVNVIENAIEASQEGETVTVTVSDCSEYVLVRIKDHGSGMDRKMLENIFVPFHAITASGAGIGMAMAKKIVDSHGGIIRVRSELGCGTEVAVETPCLPVESTPDARL
jgi:signal transduction histidine kinase